MHGICEGVGGFPPDTPFIRESEAMAVLRRQRAAQARQRQETASASLNNASLLRQ